MINIKNLAPPSFRSTVDLPMHVHKIPIHLVTQSFIDYLKFPPVTPLLLKIVGCGSPPVKNRLHSNISWHTEHSESAE